MLSEYDIDPIDPEDVMDPGGSVEPAPVKAKRTRAPNKPKVENAPVQTGDVAKPIFILLDAEGKGRELSDEEFAVEAAKAIQNPDKWTLVRGEKVTPKITF